MWPELISRAMGDQLTPQGPGGGPMPSPLHELEGQQDAPRKMFQLNGTFHQGGIHAVWIGTSLEDIRALPLNAPADVITLLLALKDPVLLTSGLVPERTTTHPCDVPTSAEKQKQVHFEVGGEWSKQPSSPVDLALFLAEGISTECTTTPNTSPQPPTPARNLQHFHSQMGGAQLEGTSKPSCVWA